MWYKNIAGRSFGLVTKHACDRRTDGRTDRIMTPKTALAWLRRAVKTDSSTPATPGGRLKEAFHCYLITKAVAQCLHMLMRLKARFHVKIKLF